MHAWSLSWAQVAQWMAIELLGRWTCSPFLSPSRSFFLLFSNSFLAGPSHVLHLLILVCCCRISILMKLPGQCRITFRLQALISIPILRYNTQGNNQDNKVLQRMECGDIWILWVQCVRVSKKGKYCINLCVCVCVSAPRSKCLNWKCTWFKCIKCEQSFQ